MARQVLRFTKETTPGVMPVSPGAGTQTYLRMTDPVANQPEPQRWEIRDAGSSGRKVQSGSAQNKIPLKIRTPLFVSQAKLLLPPFITTVGTLPGLTTFCIDRFFLREDGSTKYYTRYLGATPEMLHIFATNTGQGVVFMVELDYQCRSWNHTITNTDLADPALTAYASDQPMVFEQMSGHLTVGSLTANFKSFDFTVKHVLDMIYDEAANPIPQNYGTRDIDWKVDFRLIGITARTDFEATTAEAASFAIYDGTNTVTLNCHGVNFLQEVNDNLSLDKAFYQMVGGSSFLDTAAGDDCTITIAP